MNLDWQHNENKFQDKFRAKSKSQVAMSKKMPKTICTKVTNIYNYKHKSN